MGMELYGGTPFDFDSTSNMAREIENAYIAMRQDVGITEPLPSGANAQDRRLLFLAIARGVIQHLANNPNALLVTVTDGVDTFTGDVTSISVHP
jgi:hypothetical protein